MKRRYHCSTTLCMTINAKSARKCTQTGKCTRVGIFKNVQFNFTYRYIDDVFQSITQILRIILVRCIPLTLRSKTRRRTTHLLPIWNYYGQLRTSIYDKRDDFNFHITNFSFLSSKIPSSPAYAVFISQLIRYARACFSYKCFILWEVRLSLKLLGQGYVRERLKLSISKCNGQNGDLIIHYEVSLSQILHDILGHGHIQWHPQLIRHYTNLWTYYRTWPYYWFWTYYQISGGFHRTLQRVLLVNRGRWLLRTPGSVLFATCICSKVETDFSWAFHVFGLYILNIYFALLFKRPEIWHVYSTRCILLFLR